MEYGTSTPYTRDADPSQLQRTYVGDPGSCLLDGDEGKAEHATIHTFSLEGHVRRLIGDVSCRASLPPFRTTISLQLQSHISIEESNKELRI
jgi:hypothetical protein